MHNHRTQQVLARAMEQPLRTRPAKRRAGVQAERAAAASARAEENELSDPDWDDDEEENERGEDEEADEALEQVLATVRTKKLEGTAFGQPQPPRPAVTQRPEVLDDFIRNALLKLGMVRTCRPPTPWPLPVVRS